MIIGAVVDLGNGFSKNSFQFFFIGADCARILLVADPIADDVNIFFTATSCASQSFKDTTSLGILLDMLFIISVLRLYIKPSFWLGARFAFFGEVFGEGGFVDKPKVSCRIDLSGAALHFAASHE